MSHFNDDPFLAEPKDFPERCACPVEERRRAQARDICLACGRRWRRESPAEAFQRIRGAGAASTEAAMVETAIMRQRPHPRIPPFLFNRFNKHGVWIFVVALKGALRRKHRQLVFWRERAEELERRIEARGGDWRRRT